MYKAFLVEKGSNFESSIKRLIETGDLPLFEKEAGIIEFCLDLQIITSSIANSSIFVIIDVFSEENTFYNDGLHEVTIEYLTSMIQKGYSLNGVGTNNFLRYLGYRVIAFNKILNKIVLVDTDF